MPAVTHRDRFTDGHEQLWNERIDEALRDTEAEGNCFALVSRTAANSRESPGSIGCPERRAAAGCRETAE
jgi:hypothetical protein